MDVEVVWSRFAEEKLLDIYNYYKVKAGLKVAKNIATKIVEKTLSLKRQPRIGALEDLLKNRPQEFRYLVYTNYKIIYYINFDSRKVIIANVFDTRQDPEKIYRTQS